jgi:nuclear pore complex protein Nup188
MKFSIRRKRKLTCGRSWKRVFLYLCDPEKNSDDAGSTQSFLWHPESVRLLSHSLAPFPPPSTKTKSEFDSKTAAIHVDTSPQRSYSLDEIKSDALWLSKIAGIDEVTALRITVLEWQSRPDARLLARFSAEEATSLQDAASVDSFRVSLAGPQVMDILKKTTAGGLEDSKDFSSEKSRRLRLRHLYLSERNHILKTSRKLLSLSLRDRIPSDAGRTTVPSNGTEAGTQNGLRSLGETIFKNKTNEEESNRFLEDCVNAVQARLKDFQTEGGWLSAIETDQETEDTWRTTLVDEIVHIMQIIFLQLQSSNTIPTGALVVSWLRLMADCGFLESLSVVSTYVSYLIPESSLTICVAV